MLPPLQIRNRQRGSALIVVMSLTTATALIITTRLHIGSEMIHIDQNNLRALSTRLAGETRLRQVEEALATHTLRSPPVDKVGLTLMHTWIEPATNNEAVVEYLGCTRMDAVPLSICTSSDTQGLAVHTYRVSIRANTTGGIIRLQSLYYTHQAYNPDTPATHTSTKLTTETLATSVMTDERELLPAGRVSWVSY